MGREQKSLTQAIEKIAERIIREQEEKSKSVSEESEQKIKVVLKEETNPDFSR